MSSRAFGADGGCGRRACAAPRSSSQVLDRSWSMPSHPRRSIPGKRIAACRTCKGPRLQWRHGVSRPPRMRRLRRTDALRGMVRETRLSPADLIQPLFVRARHRACASRSPRCPASTTCRSTSWSAEARRAARRRRARRDPVRPARRTRTRRPARPTPTTGIVQLALRAIRARGARAGPDHRRLPLPVHLPRPLRRARATARSTTTSTLELLAQTARVARRGRRRRRRALAT